MAKRDRPEKLRATAFDGLAAALSPALIIGMIGSLVFFLIIAFYRGDYDVRLMYLMGLYTVAIVLVARIAIESDRTRAALFAAPLAVAAVLAMMRFVTISGELAPLSWIVNLGLLALTWYLADRITFDCTLLEEDRESIQGGLLQTIGAPMVDRPPKPSEPSDSSLATKTLADPKINASNPLSDDERLQLALKPEDRGKVGKLKKARHNPGVWVLYFALIAFPLFGLGQLVIPDERQRSLAFWCLVVYLACALALLMTTSLWGLRRYLRQRGAMMPPDITGKWLVAGGAITVVILILCMLMPLPGKQLSVAGLKIELTSPQNLPTSKYGWGNEGSDNSLEAGTVGRDQRRGTKQQGDQGDGQAGNSGQEQSKEGRSEAGDKLDQSKLDQIRAS